MGTAVRLHPAATGHTAKNLLREAALQDATISTNYRMYLVRYLGKKRRQYNPETGSEPARRWGEPRPRYRLPSAAVPRSQIGRNTPSARSNTSIPRATISTGSICEARFLREYSTSRW